MIKASRISNLTDYGSTSFVLRTFGHYGTRQGPTPQKLTPKDVGYEPNGWAEAMACVERGNWLA